MTASSYRRPNLEQLKRQARDLLRFARAHDPGFSDSDAAGVREDL